MGARFPESGKKLSAAYLSQPSLHPVSIHYTAMVFRNHDSYPRPILP
jgi:hypothetical protein